MRKLLTKKEALSTICPFSLNSTTPSYCLEDRCFAWLNIEERVEREDTIDGRQIINQISLNRHQEITKVAAILDFPGILFLEARGTCTRLFVTKIDHILRR